MSGNSIGVLFRVTTWGESHGPATGATVEGCPPGIDLTEEDIQEALDRRKPGQLVSSSPRREDDVAKILSGTFRGKTTGTPISLIIYNTDAESGAYEELRDVFRPGHGDYTYFRKYGIRDHRGGGRASGRETAARVAAGAIAGKIISRAGMDVVAYTKALGGVIADQDRYASGKISRKDMAKCRLMCPDADAAIEMEKRLDDARRRGDSLGGVVEIIVRGCPAGLGEPVFDKIDADLAKALMSIGTVKGVEIGAGLSVAEMTGSQANDPITPDGFLSNHAGGILAGITNGDEIILRVACKPISSIAIPQRTVNTRGEPAQISIRGRHDVSVIPRVIPVCEAMVSMTLADHLLRQMAINRAINRDSAHFS
ncbi:MAG: chorismate synthase [Deltaproteobacteria bacterium]|nr:chorismate synthase [Deltaproteobacteria bacterium]